jgi:acyl dehydratase
MGLLGRAVTDYVGLANLKRYQVRFTKQTWPGNTLTTKVTVTDKRKDGDDNLVDLEVELVSDDGVAVVTGSATAALPSRG